MDYSFEIGEEVFLLCIKGKNFLIGEVCIVVSRDNNKQSHFCNFYTVENKQGQQVACWATEIEKLYKGK